MTKKREKRISKFIEPFRVEPGSRVTLAKDFDESKPLAAIETARTVSGTHLAKARNAAVSGDKATLEAIALDKMLGAAARLARGNP